MYICQYGLFAMYICQLKMHSLMPSILKAFPFSQRAAMEFKTRLSQFFAVSLLLASCSSVTTERTATGQIVVSHQGVGEIQRSTPYDVDEIQALLPELSVIETVQNVEVGNVESKSIAVSDGDTEVMAIEGYAGGKVFSVSSKSTKVITSDGVTVGTALTDIFPTDVTESCAVPINYEGSARQYLVCSHPSSRRITYFFSGNWAEDFTEMPSPEALEDATLQMINWDGDS